MSSNLPINSHGRAPSHRKPAMPRASEISARLADGESLEVIAAACERTVATLRGHLNERGYDSVTGLPLRPEWATPAPPLGMIQKAQPWREDALCQQFAPDLHYPEQGGGNAGTLAEARRVCRECPVSTDCLAYALENDERWGIWAGTTPSQRRDMQRKRRSA